MSLGKKMKKNKKGFTLVELIVVLVILAILAAIAVPTFSGYITKAKEKTSAAEARSVLLAADTIIAELNETKTPNSDDVQAKKGEIIKLADVIGNIDDIQVNDGKLYSMKYTASNKKVYEYVLTQHNMKLTN